VNDWNAANIEQMELAEKDVFVIIGATRSGKGTLLTAIQGRKMSLFKQSGKGVKDSEVGKESATHAFLAPIDLETMTPQKSETISHKHNSHTFKPKIPFDPPYPKAFSGLDQYHLIDFPGIFEQRGAELDISIHLTLQKILMTARSAKVLVLVSATCLTSENSYIVDTIKRELDFMFKKPEEHLVIAITKARLVQNAYGDSEEVLSVAKGEEDNIRSFKGFKEILMLEQDDPDSIQQMIEVINKQECVKKIVKRGFLDPQSLVSIFLNVHPTEEVRANDTAEWITMLNKTFEQNVSKLEVPADAVLARI